MLLAVAIEKRTAISVLIFLFKSCSMEEYWCKMDGAFYLPVYLRDSEEGREQR